MKEKGERNNENKKEKGEKKQSLITYRLYDTRMCIAVCQSKNYGHLL